MDNTKSKWKKLLTLNNATNLALVATILILLGMGSLVDVFFSGRVDVAKILIRMVNIFLTIVVVSNIVIDTELESNTELKSEMGKSRTFEQNVLDDDFESYLVHHNRNLKKKSWKEAISVEIMQLDKKATLDDKKVFFTDITKVSESRAEALKIERETNEYYIKRVEFLEKITPEFMEEHIDTLDIEYPKVNALDLRVEHMKANNYDIIRLDPQQTRVRIVGPKLLFSGVLAIFLGLITITFLEGNTVETIVKIMLDTMLLLANISFGASTGRSVINTSYTSFYIKKNKLYGDYVSWHDKTNPGMSKVKKLLALIEEEARKQAKAAEVAKAAR
jgi:hypothetical protein